MIREYGPDGMYHGGGVSGGGVFGAGPISDDSVDMDSRMRGSGFAANMATAGAMPEIAATMRSMQELIAAQQEELRLARAERAAGGQLAGSVPGRTRLLERARAERKALDVEGEDVDDEDDEELDEDDEPAPKKKKPAKKKAPAKKKPSKKVKRK